MDWFNGKQNCPDEGAWITIGAFDGLHLGHQRIFRQVSEGAAQSHQPAAVVTFFPHPVVILRNIQNPFYLTLPHEKEKILNDLFDIDTLLTIPFDQDISNLSASAFLQQLHAQYRFSHLVVGYDFRMGKDRQGNFSVMTAVGNELGFCVLPIDPELSSNQPISSTRIRSAVERGDLPAANAMLGYPYKIIGDVVHGDGRGKHIGLPTANIAVFSQKLIPPTGVYAAFIHVDEIEYQAVVNIGYRPTFYENPSEKTIEVHILDFTRQIYGHTVILDCIQQIRPEKKFDSVEDLMDQIKQDICQAKEVLEYAGKQKDLYLRP